MQVLFPPCTMMVVEGAHHASTGEPDGGLGPSKGLPRPPAAVPSPPRRERSLDRIKNMSEFAVDESDASKGKAWKRIHVRPCFV